MKPYLVTEDLEFLMRRWAKRTGFGCPRPDFFQTIQHELLTHLSLIFPEVILIRLADLSAKLQGEITARTAGTTVVSIDQIYNQTPYHLESNRVADLETAEILGEAQRAGFHSLVDQIRSLPADKPISLVDDGCYSGETLLRIYELMQANGYAIRQFIIGIIISRKENRLLAKYPTMELIGVYEYPAVIDWVCERDFFIGVPLSGRTAGQKVNGQTIPCCPEVSLPYCLPFGDPVKCATIPAEKAVGFSRFILKQSYKLWLEVETVSGKRVLNRDVPRLPKGVRPDDQSFLDILEKKITEL